MKKIHVLKRFFERISPLARQKKRIYKEFLYKNLLFVKTSGKLSELELQERPKTAKYIYSVFAKIPGHEFIDQKYVGLLVDEINKVDLPRNRPLRDYFFKYIAKIDNIRQYGWPLGFLKATVFQLNSAHDRTLRNVAKKEGICDNDNIAELLSIFPLDFVSYGVGGKESGVNEVDNLHLTHILRKHEGKGIGGLSIKYVLNDLKGAHNVKLVYVNPRDKHIEKILRHYSFKTLCKNYMYKKL